MYIKGDNTELQKQINIERDLLDGNLNRLMVCKDDTELDSMFLFAIRRLNSLYEIKRNILLIDRIKNKYKE